MSQSRQKSLRNLNLSLILAFSACASPPVDASKDLDPPPAIVAGMYASFEKNVEADALKASDPSGIGLYFEILVLNGKIPAAVKQLERMKTMDASNPITKICEKLLQDSIQAPDFETRNRLFNSANEQILAAVGNEIQRGFENVEREFARIDKRESDRTSAPPIVQVQRIEPNFPLMWEKAKQAAAKAVALKNLKFPDYGEYTIQGETRRPNQYMVKADVHGTDDSGQEQKIFFIVSLEQLDKEVGSDNVKVVGIQFPKPRTPRNDRIQSENPKASDETRKKFLDAVARASDRND